MLAVASRCPSPNLSPAATRRRVAESPELLVKNHLRQRDQNFQSCFPEKAPKGDRPHRGLALRPAAPPDTAARIRPCSPYQSGPTPFRKLPAPPAKSRLENNMCVAGAKAPPKSTASSSRYRCLVPPRESVKVAEQQFPAHEFAAIVHQRGSARIPAKDRSLRTMPSPPRRTNISTAIRVAQA